MKLAIVTAFPPSKVTLNEYAYHLVKHFAKSEKIKELILLTDVTEGCKDLAFSTNGCWVKVKQCWSYNSYKNLFTVTKAINRIKPDAVLFNMQFMKFGNDRIAAALGLFLPLACKFKKIPSVVLLHDILEKPDNRNKNFTGKGKITKEVNTLLTKLVLKAELVALTKQYHLDVYKEKYKAPNLTLIPHGTFDIQEQSYPNAEGVLRVITFGMFGTHKKVELLIEAVELIRKRSNLVIEIVIAGTNSPGATGYLESVKTRYANVNMLNFTGYVEEYEVPALFNKSTLVVLPYETTPGNGGILHRAGSYGKAVVIPRMDQLSCLVETEGYKGEFFNPGDVNSMADAIEKLLTDSGYRRSIEQNNLEVAARYPMDKVAEMYLNIFDAMVNPKNPEPKRREVYTRKNRRISVLD